MDFCETRKFKKQYTELKLFNEQTAPLVSEEDTECNKTILLSIFTKFRLHFNARVPLCGLYVQFV